VFCKGLKIFSSKKPDSKKVFWEGQRMLCNGGQLRTELLKSEKLKLSVLLRAELQRDGKSGKRTFLNSKACKTYFCLITKKSHIFRDYRPPLRKAISSH
jgi:hypothetical protein